MKGTRQGVILDVIQRESISSQEMLRQRLHAEGVDVTQATLSRDLKELGVVKRAGDGAYQRLASGPQTTGDTLATLQRTTAEFLTRAERSEQLVVLRTDSGQAALLAIAIDRAALVEVLGTVAGDDTILVICRDAEAARSLVQRLEGWRSGTLLRMPALAR
ncbi:arginine repressor [Luteitalea sp.]|jgi:transcriptional regulator of arginine metabolism|uniref:arginine repressor n=1 Tax=Luteitalea sp. TaxID=2004800 RepID=UPI000B0F10F0|nr:arginine repressor [Luteitalea sp.]